MRKLLCPCGTTNIAEKCQFYTNDDKVMHNHLINMHGASESEAQDIMRELWHAEAHGLPAVNHPQHYGGKENPFEAIKVIEAWKLDFCLGNAVKYISRAGKKDPGKELEDLQKAKWYVERRIEQLSNKKLLGI